MPQVFNDNTGNRVIVRHRGPAGKGIPVGGTAGQILVKVSGMDFATEWVNAPNGTGAAVGPSSSTDGNFALFDGTTGKLLKSSTFSPASFASTTALADKVDKLTGKGLSQEDYTTAEKAKLANLSAANFRGTFANLAAINAATFVPAPISGDYCAVEVTGSPSVIYFWDDTNNVWTPQTQEPVDMAGADIAAVLFDADDVWDRDTCRIFTESEKNQLESHSALLASLGLTSAIAKNYGAVNYFNLTGTVVTLTGTSDGTSNMSKVSVPTDLSVTSVGFDNGGASNGRLRHTGTSSATFLVQANLSLEGSTASDFVVGIARNGAVLPESRILTAISANNDIQNVSLTLVITLLANEYLEVFMGRINGSLNPVVHTLSITAVKIN
jgi:hypothetical protein